MSHYFQQIFENSYNPLAQISIFQECKPSFAWSMFTEFLENVKKSVEYGKSMTYNAELSYSQLTTLAAQIPEDYVGKHELLRTILQAKDANTRKIISSIKCIEMIDKCCKNIFQNFDAFQEKQSKDTKGSSDLSDISEGKMKYDEKAEGGKRMPKKEEKSSEEEYGKNFKLLDFSRLADIKIGTFKINKQIRQIPNFFKNKKNA
jgi:hypothetical protein